MPSSSQALDVMVRAARLAGEGLLSDFRESAGLHVEEKGPSDFVSSADLRAQATLRRELSAAYPSYAFLMEEGAREDSSGRVARFIVDPLDGTTNFLRGLPHFSVSLALEMEGEVRVGVVFDPCKGDVFWAEEGQGAWLGDRRLSVSRETDLARSIVGTGIPHRGRGNHAAYLEALKRVMHEVAGIRRLGSAALDLAYVAAGRFDAFFEWGLSPWDVAAGMLLVREAGGVVTRGDGSPTALDSADVLAVPSESMQRRLVPLLAPFYS